MKIQVVDDDGTVLGEKKLRLYFNQEPQEVDEYQIEIKAVEAYRDARVSVLRKV